MLQHILAQYDISSADVEPFGDGLINHTFLVKHSRGDYILQQINTAVFKRPTDIADNIKKIGDFLAQHHPGYFFVQPAATTSGDTLVSNNGYYRLFPFISATTTYNVVQSPELAFEAARQFGLFTRNLQHFNTQQLAITLPHFHDLPLRYQQFMQACSRGDADRIAFAQPQIAALTRYNDIAETYNKLVASKSLVCRVTHHDTKISNVLFRNEKGLCVIDLDTVMPGYFISDIGDMMRTYLSPASEEETDLNKIEIRSEYFEAIVQGYLSHMGNLLTAVEKKLFVYAGKFMIYMQALRFMTDYLMNDVYYTITYPLQNLNRTNNQLKLLELLFEKEEILNRAVQ